MSAVHYCLFNIFAATVHIAGRSSIHILKTRPPYVVTKTPLITYGGGKRRIQGFVRKNEEKRPFRRPRRRWEEDNIKTDLQNVGAWAGSSGLRIVTVGGNV
jgi:hypothetical protein